MQRREERKSFLTLRLRVFALKCFPLFALLFFSGCRKPSTSLDQGWSAPVTVTQSKDGLMGGVVLHKWNKAIIALQGRDENAAKCFVMDSMNNSWSEAPLVGVPEGYFWNRPAIDRANDKAFFQHGYIENNQLVMSVILGRMTANGNLAMRDVTEMKWITETKTLFGEARSNFRLSERNEPRKRDWPELGHGIISGSDLYIPLSVQGFTYNGNGVAIARGPYCGGVFHSADSGKTWQLEQITDFQGGGSSVCRSKERYNYFVVKEVMHEGSQLCFSSKHSTGGSWANLSVVTKTFGYGYVTVPQNDTVHLCWLDRRHEKRRSNPVYPRRGNYEVAYCQRKDSDSSWSKDVILSEGLLYSHTPTMSVEGDKVVVAWSGIQTAGDWHAPSNPNDIYYRTSRDGGKSWDKLLKVTDGAKDGITSGEPQVVLQNGIIHLMYIQGKLNLKQESPGLTKLNQPPWQIYYQQRPFPN